MLSLGVVIEPPEHCRIGRAKKETDLCFGYLFPFNGRTDLGGPNKMQMDESLH